MLKRCVAILVALGAVALAQPDWSAYPMGNLEARFPAAPVRSSQTADSPLGPVTVTVYELERDSYRLTGSASTIPALALTIMDSRGLYTMAAKELLGERPGARNANLRFLTLLGKPGAELTYALPDGQAGKARLLLANQSMTTLEATWSGASAPADVDRFLDSLAAR